MPAKLILLFISIICAAAFFVGGVPAQPAAARDRRRAAGAVERAGRCGVARGAAAVRRRPERERARGPVDPAQHRRHAPGVRPDAGQGRHPALRRARRRRRPPRSATDRDTIPNIRLLDPSKLGDTFTQFQQRRNFYGFPDNLDIDRYTVNGKTQDYIVAARELNSEGLVNNQQDWINRHLVYTHGNGMVVAPANEVNAQLQDAGGQGGLPRFTSIDTGNAASAPEGLRVTEPRIYYGELITDYSIVGAEAGAAPREYDSDTQSYTYNGTRRGAARQLLQPAGVLAGARRAEHPVQRVDQRQLEDHVRPEPVGPGQGGRPVADAGHRPVPGGGRRAHHLDRRRLHHAGELPVRQADVAGRRHRHRPAGRAAAAGRGDQLHPQLGEGHRRRLRRHRHASTASTRPTRCCGRGRRPSRAS